MYLAKIIVTIVFNTIRAASPRIDLDRFSSFVTTSVITSTPEVLVCANDLTPLRGSPSAMKNDRILARAPWSSPANLVDGPEISN